MMMFKVYKGIKFDRQFIGGEAKRNQQKSNFTFTLLMRVIPWRDGKTILQLNDFMIPSVKASNTYYVYQIFSG